LFLRKNCYEIEPF